MHIRYKYIESFRTYLIRFICSFYIHSVSRLLDSQNVNTRECNSNYWLARDLCIPNMHIWLTFMADIQFNRQLFSIHTVFRTVHFASIFRQTTFLPHFIFSTPFFPYFNCCPRQSRLSVNWCENMPYGIMKNGPKYR